VTVYGGARARLEQAIALYERTLTDREHILGDEHPDTPHVRHNLAYAYLSVGRLEQAIALYERTLTDREHILGAEHPDTLTSATTSPAPTSRRGASPRPSRSTSGLTTRSPARPSRVGWRGARNGSPVPGATQPSCLSLDTPIR
jgi:hypothetical protein